MKVGRKSSGGLNINNPSLNKQKKKSMVLLIGAVTALLMAGIIFVGFKANSTVPVVMFKSSVHKNQAITEDLIVEYDMNRAEFEKYAYIDTGNKQRIVKWSDKDSVIGSYAAYPIPSNTVAMYDTMIKTRMNNSDLALYSFPGKELKSLDVGANDLQYLKTFLQPGDRINVDVIYTEKVVDEHINSYGEKVKSESQIVKSDSVFNDIALADLINESGQSILDIYSDYAKLSTSEQAQKDADEKFIESTTPDKVIVALTPEEKQRYYYYLAKTGVQFKISLPQRVE